MTKNTIKKRLSYYLHDLELNDKTLKLKYDCVNKLMDELYNDLATNLKINCINSFYCNDAVLKEEDDFLYVFYLPCTVFMEHISFDLKLIFVVFKNDDILYTY